MQITFPSIYLRHLIDFVKEHHIDVARWLSHYHISLAQLDEAEIQIDLHTLQAAVLDAQRFTGEPALGLLIGARLQANMHGILGYAASSGSTLRQVIMLFEKFLPLRNSLLNMSHRIEADEVLLLFHESVPLGDSQRTLLEATILAIKKILDFILVGKNPVLRAAFPFEEDGCRALARELFGCEVEYATGWAGFVLAASLLDQPLRTADPQAFQDAASICERELNRIALQTSLAVQVRRLMFENPGHLPSLALTARLLNMTPRTFHRRLLDEGTSFRALQEEVRHALAVEYLRSGRLSLGEIAYALGYTEIGNFRRAFKRWEQTPPSLYRQQHQV